MLLRTTIRLDGCDIHAGAYAAFGARKAGSETLTSAGVTRLQEWE
jgi:hypothetical protein